MIYIIYNNIMNTQNEDSILNEDLKLKNIPINSHKSNINIVINTLIYEDKANINTIKKEDFTPSSTIITLNEDKIKLKEAFIIEYFGESTNKKIFNKNNHLANHSFIEDLDSKLLYKHIEVNENERRLIKNGHFNFIYNQLTNINRDQITDYKMRENFKKGQFLNNKRLINSILPSFYIGSFAFLSIFIFITYTNNSIDWNYQLYSLLDLKENNK